MVPAFDKVAFELKPGTDQRRRHDAVRVPHHQGGRPQAGPHRAVRGVVGPDQAVPRRAEEAAARRDLHRGPEEEVQDRGPHLNERRPSRRGRGARARRAERAGDDRPRQRLDAAARRREDAGLRRRADRRHDRRRLLRERRARARRARRSPPASRPSSSTTSTTTSSRSPVSSAAARWRSTSIPSPRRRRSTSSAPATSAGTSGASPPTPASASTSSTTARSSPTLERFPAAETIEVDDLSALAPSRRAAADRLRGRRHARPHARLRGGALAGRPRSPLPRPDRQPRQGRAHLRGARGRRHAARVPRPRARPDRPRHRRHHPGRNRHQHPRGADRHPPRQGRVRGVDEVDAKSSTDHDLIPRPPCWRRLHSTCRPPCSLPHLMIAGTVDRNTTLEDTQLLFAAAREPKELWLIPNAAHVDSCDSPATEYRRRVTAFRNDGVQPRTILRRRR